MLSEAAIVAIVLSSVAVAAVSITFAVLACMGAFRTVILEAGTLDAQTFVYRTRRGAYSGIGALSFRVENFLYSHGLGRLTVAAIYYDNPAGCYCGEERYAVGFLIDPADEAARAKWEALRNTDGKKYSVLEIPGGTTTLVASFSVRCCPFGTRFHASRTAFRALVREGHELRTGCLQVYRRGQHPPYTPYMIETHFPRNHLGTFRPRRSDPFPKAAVAAAG